MVSVPSTGGAGLQQTLTLGSDYFLDKSYKQRTGWTAPTPNPPPLLLHRPFNTETSPCGRGFVCQILVT